MGSKVILVDKTRDKSMSNLYSKFVVNFCDNVYIADSIFFIYIFEIVWTRHREIKRFLFIVQHTKNNGDLIVRILCYLLFYFIHIQFV